MSREKAGAGRERRDGVVEVQETVLPGIGLRYDFVTAAGQRLGIVSHRNGHQEIVIYDRDDPDAARVAISLTPQESDTLAEILGAPRIVEHLEELHRQVEPLVVEQMELAPGSAYDGRTLGDTRARTRTGASIVAVVRGKKVFASPRPDFTFSGGDTLVVVGTPTGVAGVAHILAGS